MIEITVLGSAATMPLPGRALSSVLLKYNGRTILFDCGEGTQTAARRCGASLMKTDLIALSHYHGDHIFGLPGLLQSFGCLGRKDPLCFCGPEGLKAALEPVLRLAGPLPYPVYFSLIQADGIDFHGARLSAFPVKHRVPCFGYEFVLPRAGKFDVSKAEALGVPPQLRSALQHGESVTIEGRLIAPGMVMGPPRKGLKIVLSGDTSPCSSLLEHASGADLLICDGTYGSDDCLPDALKYGHSTFSGAAALAAEAEVRELWLSHFSQMMETPEEFLPNAADIFPASFCAYDGMCKTFRFEA